MAGRHSPLRSSQTAAQAAVPRSVWILGNCQDSFRGWLIRTGGCVSLWAKGLVALIPNSGRSCMARSALRQVSCRPRHPVTGGWAMSAVVFIPSARSLTDFQTGVLGMSDARVNDGGALYGGHGTEAVGWEPCFALSGRARVAETRMYSTYLHMQSSHTTRTGTRSTTGRWPLSSVAAISRSRRRRR